MKKDKPMRLKTLQLQNFKCFKQPEDIEFGKLTLLLGANSSGKSSTIYSILGALQSTNFPFQYSPNGKYVNMGDFKDISNNHLTSNEIIIGYSFVNVDDEARCSIKTYWKENKKNKLPQLVKIEYTEKFASINIKRNPKNYSLDFTYAPEKGKEDKKEIEHRELIKEFNFNLMTFSERAAKYSKKDYDIAKKKKSMKSYLKIASSHTK